MSDDTPRDFVRQIIDEDLAGARVERIVTRFPPEPNGYLHIGHAKSVCLNFGLAEEVPGAACFLRFDDTNPSRESAEYVEAIKADIRWLGFEFEAHLTHASDYFERLRDLAVELIRAGHAYVDSLSPEEIRDHRGTLTEPGRDSPYRDRPVEESLALFAEMQDGRHAEGSHVVRARIDMAAPNLNLRDPVMYRILRRAHQMAGARWSVYPMYDWAHGQCDWFEGVTHSLCTLEFEDHRPLYEWFLERLGASPAPRQYEFARLNLTYTVLSKRRLIELVDGGHVAGWDDPRMPTLSGLRRRGVPAEAVRALCARVGVTRKDSRVEIEMLETCVRETLDRHAPRALAVLRPLKVVITNYPDGAEEGFEAPNHPRDPSRGTRTVPFARELWIEREDFMEDPPRKFFRLAPGREVRLRFAYLVTCEAAVHDPESGEVLEVHCRYDPDTRGGNAPDGRKVKGTIHWVSARHAVSIEARLYDRLFSVASPGARTGNHLDDLNPDSVERLGGALAEPAVAATEAGATFQFERLGYFCRDPDDGADGRPAFNRVVTLRDTWAKVRGG